MELLIVLLILVSAFFAAFGFRYFLSALLDRLEAQDRIRRRLEQIK